MALMDLKSNLSWYGKTPPTVDNLGNNDAPGFTAKRQELAPSEFKGIQGGEYTHTGIRQLGTLKFADWFLNDNAKGFGPNAFPLGGPKSDTQFVGISGEEFTYTGLLGIGDLDNNIRRTPGEFESYIPTVGNNGSKFIYNEDFTVSVAGSKGFNRYGTTTETLQIPNSKDSFAIDDMTMSDRGLAKRKAQGGTGHPFTNELGYGPYSWKPEVHTGWHSDNKYSNTIKKNSKAGLADTYTDKSPIDDLYNKLNLRDDATPNSYIKHPLILRGIQRPGKVDNQRWGAGESVAGQISSALDLPRGGVLTSIERGVVDIARLATFMVSPRGLAFVVKQVGMQLMNPNVEGPDGKTQKPWHLNSTKAWTPINTLLQPLAGIAGMHIKRHGTLPVDLPGLIPGNYEGVMTSPVRTADPVSNNRLVLLTNRYLVKPFIKSPGKLKPNAIGIGGHEFSTPGQPKQGGILSGMTGPESVGGIGSTLIKRWTDTGIESQLGLLPAARAGAGGLTTATYLTGRYSYSKPYTGTLDLDKEDPSSTANKIQRGNAADYEGTDGGASMTDLSSLPLASRVGLPDFQDTAHGTFHSFNLPDGEGVRKGSVIGQGGADHKSTAVKKSVPEQESVMNGKAYATTAFAKDPNFPDAEIIDYMNVYSAVRRITKDRTPQSPAIIDFRTMKTSPKEVRMTNYGSDKKLNPNGDKTLNTRGYPDFSPGVVRTDLPDTYWSDPKEPGLIPFYFNPIDPANNGRSGNIGFRAYIDSLDDAFTPTWTTNKDQGRADNIVQYTGFGRTISISFKVPITSKAESTEVWSRLNRLARITLPKYGGTAGFYGQFVAVTIGSLYTSIPMYINDLTYSWDSETPWEITAGEQVPFYTSVDMSLGWVGNSAPSSTQNVYNYG